MKRALILFAALSILAGQVRGAIVNVAYASPAGSSSLVSSLTITPASSLLAGDIVIVPIACSTAWEMLANTPANIDWSIKIRSGTGSSSFVGVAIGRVRATETAFNINIQSGSTGAIAACYGVYRSDTGNRLRVDVAVSAVGTSTAPDSGATATTATASELVIGAFGSRAQVTFSVPTSSSTIRASTNSTVGTANDRSCALSDKFVSSTGTQDLGLTISASNIWAAWTITIEETPAGGSSDGFSRAKIINKHD